MVQKNKIWVYNNEIVKNHSLAVSWKSTLQDVSNKDYPNRNYFNPVIECLDLDAYVDSLKLSRTPKTMDAAIGISDYIQNHSVSPRMLLVELRMDYESDKHLSVSALKEKERESRGVVLDSVTRVDSHSVFIFTEECIEEVRSWHNKRMIEDGTLSNWMFMSVPEFNHVIKDANLMPISYIHDIENIKDELKRLLCNQGMESFVEQILYWNDRANHYEWIHYIEESKHLKNGLKDVWHEMICENSDLLSENDDIWIALVEDECRYLRGKI